MAGAVKRISVDREPGVAPVAAVGRHSAGRCRGRRRCWASTIRRSMRRARWPGPWSATGSPSPAPCRVRHLFPNQVEDLANGPAPGPEPGFGTGPPGVRPPARRSPYHRQSQPEPARRADFASGGARTPRHRQPRSGPGGNGGVPGRGRHRQGYATASTTAPGWGALTWSRPAPWYGCCAICGVRARGKTGLDCSL